MLLALDVGNTDITLGVFQGDRLLRRSRLPTDTGLSVSELGSRLVSGSGLGKRRVDAAIFASVVPKINAKLEQSIRLGLGCEVLSVTPSSPLGLKLRVKRPEEVGADRIANALAAIGLFGAPAVVIDFGTATTFDCISRQGEYLGGAILPGPNMASRALAEFTAQLPRIQARKPRRVIGRDTVECIEAGLYFGYLGMIEKILKLTLREMGGHKPTLLATGGLAGLFAEDLPLGIQVVSDLTLQGIRIAFEDLSRGNHA